MALLRSLALATALTLLPAAVTTAAPGDFDRSFGDSGIATFDWGGFDGASDVLVQPDGRIVTAGFGGAGLTDFILGRATADGRPDAGFSLDGISPFALTGTDWAYAVARQPDGKIVAVGDTQAVDAQAVVVRTNPDGTPDASFGIGGVATLDYGGRDSFDDLVIQPDGKIVAVGHGGANSDVVATRLTPQGVPDPSFDGEGTAQLDYGGSDHADAVALQTDGKLVLGGNTTDNGVWVARLNSDGSPDTSFDGGGQKPLDPASGDFAHDLMLQPDGRIVLIGGAAGDGFLVTRLNPDGSYDDRFGDGESLTGISFANGSTSDQPRAAVLQANGKIVIAGYSMFGNGSIQLAVARLQPGGALDTTFSSDGRQSLSGGASPAFGVALQPNGRIVVAGSNSTDVLVARLEGDQVAAGGGPPGGDGGLRGGDGDRGGGGGVTQVPRCAGKRATIVGTNRSDRLVGTRRADVIVALGGNDRIASAGGNDRICAGDGNDRIDGGTGNDRLYGQNGKDTLAGGAGKDNLTGGTGRDRMSGGSGHDSCNGGASKDRATCERRKSL